jgi:diadenosine tetraphosphate (Ap4A) HIT family hydrolase
MQSLQPELKCGVCGQLYGPTPVSRVFANDLWHVRHLEPPYPVPGWMVLTARRHVAGPAQFTDREARSFGPTLCHLQRVLLEVTDALRIYTAALGESSPHFHCHMVPRYATMPKEAKAWAVFDLQRAAAAGEITIDAGQVRRVVEAYEQALAEQPPPAL